MEQFDASVFHVDSSDENAESVVLRAKKAKPQARGRTASETNMIVLANTEPAPNAHTGLYDVNVLQAEQWPQSSADMARQAMSGTVANIGHSTVLLNLGSCVGGGTGTFGPGAESNALVTLVMKRIREIRRHELETTMTFTNGRQVYMPGGPEGAYVLPHHLFILSSEAEFPALKRLFGNLPWLNLSCSVIELNAQLNTHLDEEKPSVLCYGTHVNRLLQQLQMSFPCEFCTLSTRQQIVLPRHFTPAMCGSGGQRTHYLAFYGGCDRIRPKLDSGSNGTVVSYDAPVGDASEWGMVILRKQDAEADSAGSAAIPMQVHVVNILDNMLSMDNCSAMDMLWTWSTAMYHERGSTKKKRNDPPQLQVLGAQKGFDAIIIAGLRVAQRHVNQMVDKATGNHAGSPPECVSIGRTATMGAADFRGF